MGKTYFILGPAPASKKVLKSGGKKLREFRNDEFSKLTKKLEKQLLVLANAPKGSKVIFLASSGTGAMQGAVDNFLDKNTSTTIINGGGFGERFVKICKKQKLNPTEFKIGRNEKMDYEKLSSIKSDTLFINSCETSTGRLYDIKKIGEICKKNDTLFIVDAISSFLCDEIDMKKQHIDAMLISSNKGLALSPGLAIVILNKKAQERLKQSQSFYFDFKEYLLDMQRGQTPFTPPISILYQLETRLKELSKQSLKEILAEKKKLSLYLRNNVKDLPLKPYVKDMANSMTSFSVEDDTKASELIKYLEKEHDIILRNNGGALRDTMIRISNMGKITKKDIDKLIKALHKYYER